ncbi:SAM-dependent methyltransferase [Bradyrhizobium sp. GM5.1]
MTLIERQHIHNPDADAKDVMWRAVEGEFPVGSDVLSAGAPRYWIPIPSAELREASSVADMGFWYAIGEAWSQTAIKFVRTDKPRILDIGCGSGKMARFFTMIPGAAYLGIDIFKPAIEWSQVAFAALDNFNFKHFDIRSPLYNGNGTLDVATTPVPAPGDSFDLIICGSLFTHLLAPAFKHYLREVARCLSVQGRAVISTHNEPNDERFSGKETRIDIADSYLLELAEASGLRLVEKVGTVFGQEVFIFERLR